MALKAPIILGALVPSARSIAGNARSMSPVPIFHSFGGFQMATPMRSSSVNTRCSRRPRSSLTNVSKRMRTLGSSGLSGPAPAIQVKSGSSANALAREAARLARSVAVARRMLVMARSTAGGRA
jgi:hypothetical protein